MGFSLRSSGKFVMLALIHCAVLNKVCTVYFYFRVIIVYSVIAFCNHLLTTVISQIYYQS